MVIENSRHGEKGIALKLKLKYEISGQKMEQTGLIDAFPKEF